MEEILREAQTHQGAAGGLGGTRTVVSTFLLSILLSTCLQRLSNHLSLLILNVSLPCLSTLAAVFDSLYLLSVITACVCACVRAQDTGIFVRLLPNKSKVEARDSLLPRLERLAFSGTMKVFAKDFNEEIFRTGSLSAAICLSEAVTK